MPLWKILMERIKELETPCFILDQEELTRNIVGFRNAESGGREAFSESSRKRLRCRFLLIR